MAVVKKGKKQRGNFKSEGNDVNIDESINENDSEESDESEANEKYDFLKITHENWKQLDYDDPKLLKQLFIKPLPDFSNVSSKSKFNVLRHTYIKLLVSTLILEHQRKKLLRQLMLLKSHEY